MEAIEAARPTQQLERMPMKICWEKMIIKEAVESKVRYNQSEKDQLSSGDEKFSYFEQNNYLRPEMNVKNANLRSKKGWVKNQHL